MNNSEQNPQSCQTDVIGRFNISDGLKNHYLFYYPIEQLIETFILIFEKEKKEMMRIFIDRLESIYGEPSFSPTVYNISDMIVYKYFNDELSFAERALVKSKKNKEYPFRAKILEMEGVS
jgi:hypothetical protein